MLADPDNHIDPLTQMLRIQTRAKELMDEHELYGWRFEIAATKNFVGRCFYRRRVIEFSKYYLESPWHDIEDTLRHEIAHALVYIHHGPSHGHDEVWKHYARQLGADPKSCSADSVSTAKFNYEISCTSCGRSWKRHRLKAGYENGKFKSGCCHAEMEVKEL